MLYACGSNGNGQLGIRHNEDVSEWTPVPLDLEGPIDLAGGGNHTIIVEHSTGSAYTTENNVFRIIPHPAGIQWLFCSAGWDFTFLVDADNRLWQVTFPFRLDLMPWVLPSAVESIESGMRHTVVRLVNGQVFAWGASRKAQCGIVASEVTEPNEIEVQFNKPVAVACGRDYTVVLQNEMSAVTVWGPENKFPDLKQGPQPDKIDLLLSGWSHIMLGKKMYGTNFHNQLELPVTDFETAALGSEHGLCVQGTTVYTWGWGEHGNCPAPKRFESPGNVRVFGGCATSFVYV